VLPFFFPPFLTFLAALASSIFNFLAISFACFLVGLASLSYIVRPKILQCRQHTRTYSAHCV
jgi:ABC-type dipeptide/oligopeptide/nickel transport system permease subunit